MAECAVNTKGRTNRPLVRYLAHLALVLVCLANKAESYEAFMGADHFAINLLSND